MSTEVKRIAVFGTESTGKTQLAQVLARRFSLPWVAEYAREFWDAQGGVIALEDMVPIAQEQWRREDAAVAEAARARLPAVICDTEALTTMLWSDLLYGTCPEEVRRGAERRCHNYALYLLLQPDVPWGEDPQRCFPAPEDRQRLGRVWRGALERRGLPHVTIAGAAWEERERAAIAAVDALLRT